jgi:hypothetical protein
VIENSELLSDLTDCVRPIMEIEILQYSLLILRRIFSHSPFPVQIFIESGSIPSILSRIKVAQNQNILKSCLNIVKIIAEYGFTQVLKTDQTWMIEVLKIPEWTSEPSFLVIFVDFVEWAVRLFPQKAAKLWKKTIGIFKYSIGVKSRDWKLLQKSILEVFLKTIKMISDPISFLKTGIVNEILKTFGKLPQFNQMIAINIIIECFWERIPPNCFLSFAVSNSIDFIPLFEALRSGNSELKVGVIGALKLFFVYNGDLIESANEIGLPNVLIRLVDSENFLVKSEVLKLVKVMVINCHSDRYREPFLSNEFLELLLSMIDDVGDIEISLNAKETVLTLQRTFRSNQDWIEPFIPFIE